MKCAEQNVQTGVCMPLNYVTGITNTGKNVNAGPFLDSIVSKPFAWWAFLKVLSSSRRQKLNIVRLAL